MLSFKRDVFWGFFFFYWYLQSINRPLFVCLFALLPLLAFDQTFDGGATHTRCIWHVSKPSGCLIEEWWMLVNAIRRSRAVLTHTHTHSDMCRLFSLIDDHFKIMTLIKEKCSDKLELKFSYFHSLVCFLLFFILYIIFVMMVIIILLAIIILLIIEIPHAVAQRCFY